MKKIISFILAIVITIGFLPNFVVTADAASNGAGKKISLLANGCSRDFVWPVPSTSKISSCFLDPNGHSSPHYAIDIPAPRETNIVAAYDGTVYKVLSNKSAGNSGFGKSVILKHKYNLHDGTTITLYTKYSHMNSIDVKVNQKVIKGKTVLGGVGSTGVSYGNHLDFQILYTKSGKLASSDYGNRKTCSVDPFVNNLLELPKGLTAKGAASSNCTCCFDYVKHVKLLYKESLPSIKAEIITQPKSVTAFEGKTAKVSVTASGQGLTYKWYYKNKGASKFSLTNSFIGNTYSVTMDSSRNGRQVYCVVTDKHNNVVTSKTVTLSMAKITTQPKSVAVAAGEKAKTSIKTTGDGLTYQWYYKDPGKSSFSKSSLTGTSYSVTMSSKNDGRQIYCKVTDTAGNSVNTNTVTLSIKKTAKITTQPKSVAVAAGATAKTSVKATGDGLKYQWYYKNPGKSSFSKSSVTSATYSLTITEKVNGRKVYCKVTDKYGNSVNSDTVTLSIKKIAKITTQPKSVTVVAGEKAKTSINATGDGLTYQWYYKDPGNSSYTKSSLTGTTYSVTMSSKNDGRQIYCKVTDKYGNSVKTNTVTLNISKVAKTSYPSYCTIKATAKTSAMSLPCSSGTDKNSTVVESVAKDKTYTATALILNSQGNYWYKVTTSSGKTAYVPSSKMSFVKDLVKEKKDITISGTKAPSTLAVGKSYSIEGTIKASHSKLTKVAAYVYPGESASGKSVTGGSVSVSSNSYSLKGSAVDSKVLFNKLPAGRYTYAVYGYYTNYYAKSEKTRAETTGKICLYTKTFTVE